MKIDIWLQWNEKAGTVQCLKLSQKSCRSACLESQIINIKLKKNQQKVPGPPPKLSGLGLMDLWEFPTLALWQPYCHRKGYILLVLIASGGGRVIIVTKVSFQYHDHLTFMREIPSPRKTVCIFEVDLGAVSIKVVILPVNKLPL